MKRLSLVILAVLSALFVHAQTEKDKQFAAAEEQFFESCKQQFPFIKKVYAVPYRPTPPSAFPPSTVELFIEVKDDVTDRNATFEYAKNKRNIFDEITGRYTSMYVKTYESQLQIMLYVLTPKCLYFKIL